MAISRGPGAGPEQVVVGRAWCVGKGARRATMLSIVLWWMNAAPTPAGQPAALASTVTLVPVYAGLVQSLFVTHAGDGSGRLFIIERAGVVRVANGSLLTTFLDIRPLVKSDGAEQGLLGLAFHPNFLANGRFFVYYTAAGSGALTIARYSVSTDPSLADAGSSTVLLSIPHPTFNNHNGGMLAFGPDGYLYAGTGDGGSGGDPSNHAQDLTSLPGHLLRLDVN